MHPALEFTGTSLDLTRLAESYFAVTAPAPVLPIAQALVVEMGGEPVVVAEADRPAYAEAIATATSFSRAIVEQSTGILLRSIGVENPGSYLSSLIRSAVDNALTRAGAPTRLGVEEVLDALKDNPGEPRPGDGGPRRRRARLVPPRRVAWFRPVELRPEGRACLRSSPPSPSCGRRVAEARRSARQDGPADAPVGRVVLVPTMGALHEGHLRLVSHARDLGGFVVVSIFVNPLQFGAGEDLDRYPRTLDADVEALEGLADVVFAPTAAEMYPNGASETRVSAGESGACSRVPSRPGHFDGVLTVVSKLFNIVQPDAAVFGQKDAQQVHVIGRMVDDLNLPVSIVVVDTVREGDGLALSSRNRYLGEDDRAAAVALSRALAAGADASTAGVPRGSRGRARAHRCRACG